MSEAFDYYSSAFSPESLYGFYQLVAIFSLVVLVWMIGLSYLVLKANSRSAENRFMAVLLFCEGIKASFLALEVVPYSSHWQSLWDILFPLKMEPFMVAQITSILLYISFPIYYRVNLLKFLHNDTLKKHVWYLAPALGLMIWVFLRGQEGFGFENASWIICNEAGSEPIVKNWWGTITERVSQYASEIGTCSRDFDRAVVDEPAGSWGIILLGPIFSLIGLLFLRASMKQSQRDTEGTTTYGTLSSRSLYIGFLGKVIGQLSFFFIVLAVLPTLNGGVFFEFADSIRVQYGADPTSLDRTLFFIWSLTLVITPAAIGFEALMFVHATLKDTVFGIDANLRNTFRNTMFAGFGAFSFVFVSEAMENVVGYGMFGGVFIGAIIIFARHPIIRLIDVFSSKLIPEEYTPGELKYLEAYAETIEDFVLTSREKVLLGNLATAYEISEERLAVIEEKFRESLALGSNTTILIREEE
ncbi:MAG: hypothetical protein CMA16_02210 [Euryarchaeota archaeon]|nr:hypothetical protein [Euryarchaeota archaeon]